MTRKGSSLFLVWVFFAVLCLMASGIVNAAPRTLEVWVWGGEVWEGVYREFQKTHPDINLKFLPITGGFDERKQKLLTAVAGGMSPDVMLVDRFEVSQWAAFGALMPLDELIRKRNIAKSAYIPQTWDEAIFPWDGHVYALPLTTDDRLIFWNKTIFKETGLDPNEFPYSWEEQRELNKKLTIIDAKGNVKRVGFALVEGLGGNGAEWALGWANGGEYMRERSTKVTLDDPKLVETLEYLIEMTDISGGVERVSAFKGEWGVDNQSPFFVGKIAAMINGNWNLGAIARYAPSLDFGVAPIYRRDILRNEKRLVPITFSGGHALAIPRGAKNVDDAFEFIRWITGIDGARAHIKSDKAFSESLGRPWVPNIYAYSQANEEAFALFEKEGKVGISLQKAFKTAVDLMKYTRFRDRSPAALLMQREFLGHARDEALYHKKTAVKALNDAKAAIQKELDRLISDWEKRTGKSLR